jgi:hypothetical protein
MPLIDHLRAMPPERFEAIYRSLEHEGYGPLDAQVAQLLKFRPQAIKKLSIEQRARKARLLIERKANAELAYEIFGAYLLKHHKELVTSFLDQTGVPHEDGLISDVGRSRPAAEKLGAAIAELDRRHPPEDVTLYLALCAEQWPGEPALLDAWRARS